MPDWIGVCRLDVYIYDYLVKRNLHNSAKAFMNEGKVATDPVGMLLLLYSVTDLVANNSQILKPIPSLLGRGGRINRIAIYMRTKPP